MNLINRILITGSLGFVGAEVVKRIKNDKVIKDSKNSEHIDLRNIEQVMKLGAADIVIHLGGKGSTKNLKWNEYFENNILGTMNILEYCVKKNIKKMIYVSSYVYGNPEYIPIDENHPTNPHNAYTESKFLGEKLCEWYSKRTNLSVIILRPFNIFGKTLKEGFLITNLINSTKSGEKITIINRTSKRDFLYIDDFIDLIFKIIDYEAKFEIFNIGSGESYSFDEIIKKIETITSRKINLEYIENKENYIEDIKADITKINEKTNWKPKIKFNEGLQRILKI